MSQYELSDRYWMKPDQGGWQIRYGSSGHESQGECIGHLHEKKHAELICAAVNALLVNREQKRKP